MKIGMGMKGWMTGMLGRRKGVYYDDLHCIGIGNGICISLCGEELKEWIHGEQIVQWSAWA
jgi:hypothetical protein